MGGVRVMGRYVDKFEYNRMRKRAQDAAGAEGTLKSLNEGILQTVRLRGGSERKTSTVIDEHRRELTPPNQTRETP